MLIDLNSFQFGLRLFKALALIPMVMKLVCRVSQAEWTRHSNTMAANQGNSAISSTL